MGTLCATVGALHGTKQLLLDAIGVSFVQQLVGLGERRQRRAQRIRRLGNRVEQLLPGVGCRVGHRARLDGREPSPARFAAPPTSAEPLSCALGEGESTLQDRVDHRLGEPARERVLLEGW